jgi:hypothetical protein
MKYNNNYKAKRSTKHFTTNWKSGTPEFEPTRKTVFIQKQNGIFFEQPLLDPPKLAVLKRNRNALGFHIFQNVDKILISTNVILQEDPSNAIRNEVDFANANGFDIFLTQENTWFAAYADVAYGINGREIWF